MLFTKSSSVMAMLVSMVDTQHENGWEGETDSFLDPPYFSKKSSQLSSGG